MPAVCSVCIILLFRKGIIGDDTLANLSIERTEAGNITGHVRIRNRTRGAAPSLGDRITTSENSRLIGCVGTYEYYTTSASFISRLAEVGAGIFLGRRRRLGDNRAIGKKYQAPGDVNYNQSR